MPPSTRADTTPVKHRPDDPGGLIVPNQGSTILNQGSDTAAPTFRVLPQPEAPLPRPAEPSTQPVAPPGGVEPLLPRSGAQPPRPCRRSPRPCQRRLARSYLLRYRMYWPCPRPRLPSMMPPWSASSWPLSAARRRPGRRRPDYCAATTTSWGNCRRRSSGPTLGLVELSTVFRPGRYPRPKQPLSASGSRRPVRGA